MKPFAIAALCAGLAATPLVAKAADLVLFNAAGQPVAVLVPTAAPLAVPAIPSGFFDQQDAVLNDMMQSMRTMEAAFSAGPLSLDPAAFSHLQPGAAVITTSFSDGHNTCSRTVTYEQRGDGQPLVQVRQTGDDCSALPAVPGGRAIPAALPPADLPDEAAPQRVVPHDNSDRLNLIHVDYRHPVHKPRPIRG